VVPPDIDHGEKGQTVDEEPCPGSVGEQAPEGSILEKELKGHVGRLPCVQGSHEQVVFDNLQNQDHFLL
jgi:hypothetical protein